MNMTSFIGSLALSAVLVTSAFADARELNRAELHENVRSGKSMSLARLLNVMSPKVGGEIIDVRGFESGWVYFRVVVKRDDGRMAVAIVDARNGRFLHSRSRLVKDITAAANTSSSKSKSASRIRAQTPTPVGTGTVIPTGTATGTLAATEICQQP